MRISYFLLVTLLLSPVAFADDLKEFKFEVQGQAPVAPTVCSFGDMDIPDNMVVYAAGGYTGRKLDYQIDQSGHAATQFDIAVNSKRKPVALILGAYEPTIWNIGWTRGTEIVAILAQGYHRQVVAGVPDDVPVLTSSYEDKGPCGRSYVRKGRNEWLNPTSRRHFGRDVSLVYPGDRSGKIAVGDPFSPNHPMVTSAENTPESYRDDSAPVAGPAGLEVAVEQGFLRIATKADADAWIRALMKRNPDPDVPPVAGEGIPEPPRPRMHNAYVVLKPFTFPAGLYGANSATFFVPEGVPRPKGNPGHSTVYDFNLMNCKGPAGCR